MKRKYINLFSIVILAIFIGSITYLLISVINDYNLGLKQSENKIKELSNYIEQNPEEINKDFFIQNKEIISIKYSKNNQVLFSLPDKTTAENIKTSRFIKVYYKTIVKNEDSYELKTAFYILNPQSIYIAAKKSFFIILGATIITIAMLIFVSVKTTPYSENIPDTSDSDAEENDNDQENNDTFSNDFSIQNEIEENSPTEQNEINIEDINTEAEQKNESAENETTENPQNSSYDNNDITKKENEISEDCTLTEKIDILLKKAEQDNSDLSLFLIEINNSDKLPDIKTFLSDNYGKDKVYDYSSSTFALLRENTSIDEAEDKAAFIQNNIETLFDEKNLFIGLSSRSIRTLSAERLICEAEEALNHAKNEPDSRIVGFHVDVEKYKEIIENNKKSAEESL